MIFEAPGWLFALALLPIAGVVATWLVRRDQQRLASFVARPLWGRVVRRPDARIGAARAAFLLLGAGFVIVALARPQWGIVREKVEREGKDVVLVLDTSGSMATADVAPSRFFLARQALLWSVIISVPLALLGLALTPAVIGLFGVQADVAQVAQDYLHITIATIVTLIVTLIGGGVLRGIGDSRTPMLITALANLINVGLAYALIYGAFATEVFRGAFLAVDRGQIEAAYSFGMHRKLALRRIILPQMWRFALPGLGNLWLVLIKATSLMSIIQLPELMRMTDVAARAVRLPFTFYFGASLIYLTITIISIVVLQRAERWANRGVRRA